jgi:prepilin-type N-terminal cleavage/methylation domain-containing protein
VKTQILATGFNKSSKGFTLLELLVVLLIIGIASSVILVNTSSINNIIKGETSVEKNFQLISEESILSSKILGWFPGKSSQKIYILDSSGNKTTEFNSE